MTYIKFPIVFMTDDEETLEFTDLIGALVIEFPILSAN